MSAIVHPNAFLWSRSTLSNFPSSVHVKIEEIMTGNVEFSPKYADLKWDDNFLSSSLGEDCMESTSVDDRC